MQPGKADAKKVDGKTNKEQTRVLTDYLKNLHNKYTAECPENKISQTTFARLRPTNPLLASFISRNTCQCLHHQNMVLKVQFLRKAGIRISEIPENLIVHKDDLGQLVSSLPERVSYRVWKKVDIGNRKMKMKIVELEEDGEKFKADLANQLCLFEQHVQRVKEQYQQVRLLKENLPEDEMMLQIDFTENYSCWSLNEVQTAYWNQTMVTIHPVVAYYRDNGELKHKSYVLVSDEMAHASSTVCAFIDRIIPELTAFRPNLSAVHYWTDSPSSQYRNRYISHVLANHENLYNIRAHWNYFEVGHGKGQCDGLGGTTKRMADLAIRQGRIQIQNAADFYRWGLNSTMSAIFLYVNTEDTKRKQTNMNLIKTKPLKGTMKLHAVGSSVEPDSIMPRETSCYCNICLSGLYCNTWTRTNFKCQTATGSEDLHQNDIAEQQIQGPHAQDPQPDRGNEAEKETDTSNGEHIDIDIEIGSVVAAIYDNNWYW